MTQTEYLNQLEAALRRRGVQNIFEIMQDYRDHFTFARESGKSEEEIITKLGSPDVIAKAYETEGLINQIKSPESGFSFGKSLNVLARLLLLAPFNFFVLFIPGLIVLVILITGWSVAIGLFASGLAVTITTVTANLFAISSWVFLAGCTAGLGVVGISLLIGIAVYYLTKSFILGCISYLQWNLKFLLEK